jgi:hypothetical protein
MIYKNLKFRQIFTDNVIAFIFALFSSSFLFISGYNGVANWLRLEEIILSFLNLGIIHVLFIIVIIISSFGGLVVLIGGILILFNKIFVGNLFISLGTGAGLISFAFNFIISISTNDFSLSNYLSFSSLGVIFAILAQTFSNKKNMVEYFHKILNFFKFRFKKIK